MDRSQRCESDADARGRQEHTRVLFIGGSMKSGSTLLGTVLGQLPGFFNVGEIGRFWTDASVGQRRCGCGVPVTDCEFWSKVVADLAAGGVDISRMAELAGGLDETKRLGRVLARRLRPATAREWNELATGTQQLYQSVARHCEQPFIVDASKLPTHLLLLRELPGLDIRLLHLVRDGRAVAYSWERKRRRRQASATGIRGLRGHRHAVSDLAIWVFQNFVIDLLGRRSPRRTVLRYEDFATSPGSAAGAALAELAPDLAVDPAGPGSIGLAPTHAIAGSDRVRFAGPGTGIALDEAWRRELPPSTIRAWSLLASPALRRFGYRIW